MKLNHMQLICPILLLIVLLSSCQKKDFDGYYDRPEGLASPIYQQLQEKGNFTSFIKLIDKSGYKSILSASGYWTLFAPNDAAFTAYLQAQGRTSVDQIDSIAARKVVEYALVYNAFKTDHIADFQSALGWVPNTAFRRRTALYDFVYDGTANGTARKLIAANRNGNYLATDNNNKYLTYFYSAFMSANSISATDYNYFYPNSIYSGFNVANAQVVTRDIIAENGVIHEVNQVIEPQLSIDQYLEQHPEYSEFKKILDQFKVTYSPNDVITERYQLVSNSPERVYVKLYDASLAFSLNNENFLKQQDNDGQANCWTIFIPRNEQLLAYINNTLLEHYPVKSISQLPAAVITDFINSHLWQSAVWPSKFATTTNFLSEQARFDPNADVTDKKILSNGIFYGTTKVQQANVFHTVYGRPYLDPAYSLMTRALDLERKIYLTSPNLNYALIMVSDVALRAKGFDWNTANSTFQYTAPGGTAVIGADAVNRIKRIINTHIIAIPAGGLNLSGLGLAETIGGEIIKYTANSVSSSGTADNTAVTQQQIKIGSRVETRNGTAYYGDGLLTYSELNIGNHLAKYAVSTTDPYYSFYRFLLNSASMYTAATGLISGTLPGNFYTVLVPDNAAILSAVRAGKLPATAAGAANYTPTAAADILLVSDFIKHHIIKGASIIANGNKEGNFETLLTDNAGYPVTVRVTNQTGILQFTDQSGTTATVTGAANSNLSNRTVIHQINTYLK